jgi:Flp pilus assembly protein TadD
MEPMSEVSARAEYLRGLSLQRSGELDGAEGALRRVLGADPSHHGARVNLARVLVKMARSEEALTLLDGATPASQSRDDSWNVRGLALLELGRTAEAEAAFAMAVEINPDNVHAWNNQGLCMLREGRFEEAVLPLSKAVSFERAPAHVFNNLGLALEKTGQLAAAREAFARATEMGHGWSNASLQRVDSALAMTSPGEPDSLAPLMTRALDPAASVGPAEDPIEGTTAEAVRSIEVPAVNEDE